MKINGTEVPNIPGIYKLTNKINGKCYIGESKHMFYRIETDHKKGGKQIIHKAIKKYGWENFEIEVIDSFDYLDKTELLALEAAYIEYYNSLTVNLGGYGYNVCKCGMDKKNLNISEETKQKISRGLKGKYCGEKSPNFGKPSWNKGIKYSEEQCKHMSEITKNQDHTYHSKQVKQINKDTNEVIKIWKSIAAGARGTNGRTGDICEVCKCKRKTAYGFKWEYVTDPSS